MTLEDIKAMDREMLTPEIVGKVIGVNPQTIRVAARPKAVFIGLPRCRYWEQGTYSASAIYQNYGRENGGEAR